MSFADWVQKLAGDLGLARAGEAPGQVLELELGGGIRCSIEPSPSGSELLLSSALAPLPANDVGEVLEQLLIANSPELSAGPVFAIEPQRDEVVLQRAFSPQSDADYDAFVVALGQFAQEARQWKDRLLQGRWADDAGEGEPTSDEAVAPIAHFMKV